jgi:hypothetical protein
VLEQMGVIDLSKELGLDTVILTMLEKMGGSNLVANPLVKGLLHCKGLRPDKIANMLPQDPLPGATSLSLKNSVGI